MERKTMQSRVGFRTGSLVLMMVLVIIGASVIGEGISPEIPILASMMLVMLWAKLTGFAWQQIDAGLIEGVKKGIVPMLIFILIGALIGIWIAAGTIPSLMVFGFHLIRIRWFLPSAFLVTAIIGSAIGSAFTVISTLGVAFMGMGLAMYMNPAMVAGAVLCGAIFGDKSSPLSATDNLSAAVVGADLIDHIKNLMWSTIPSLITTFVIFCFLGNGNDHLSLQRVHLTIAILQSHFAVTWWAALPVILLLICAWLRIPTIATLFINIAVSIGMFKIVRPGVSLRQINQILVNGFHSTTGNHIVDTLLSRGGIMSMMSTLSLVIIALALGGLLVHLGIIQAVMTPLVRRLRGTGTLIIAVVLSCIGVNVLIGEQYSSIILPAAAFGKTFREHGLAPVALSRALEDGGTVINYLIPWGVAGAFVANALHVPVIQYLPFVFFSWLSPVFSILSGMTGIGVKRLKNK